jgi:hypothetical protein
MMNPEHLLDQAESLLRPAKSGRPRQSDLRGAISSAYYAVFHAVAQAAADEFIGGTKRAEPIYGLVHRSIDHRWLRDLCSAVQKCPMPKKFTPYQPTGGFGADLQTFSFAVERLQKRRHDADYDPMIRLSNVRVRRSVDDARSALSHFDQAPADQRTIFLSLLLFEPR